MSPWKPLHLSHDMTVAVWGHLNTFPLQGGSQCCLSTTPRTESSLSVEACVHKPMSPLLVPGEYQFCRLPWDHFSFQTLILIFTSSLFFLLISGQGLPGYFFLCYSYSKYFIFSQEWWRVLHHFWTQGCKFSHQSIVMGSPKSKISSHCHGGSWVLMPLSWWLSWALWVSLPWLSYKPGRFLYFTKLHWQQC